MIAPQTQRERGDEEEKGREMAPHTHNTHTPSIVLFSNCFTAREEANRACCSSKSNLCTLVSRARAASPLCCKLSSARSSVPSSSTFFNTYNTYTYMCINTHTYLYTYLLYSICIHMSIQVLSHSFLQYSNMKYVLFTRIMYMYMYRH